MTGHLAPATTGRPALTQGTFTTSAHLNPIPKGAFGTSGGER